MPKDISVCFGRYMLCPYIFLDTHGQNGLFYIGEAVRYLLTSLSKALLDEILKLG